jgi:hypothetical protein
MIVCSLPGKCGFGFLSAAEGKHTSPLPQRARYTLRRGLVQKSRSDQGDQLMFRIAIWFASNVMIGAG